MVFYHVKEAEPAWLADGRSPYTVEGKRILSVHGMLCKNRSEQATLIVLQISFATFRVHKRITDATIWMRCRPMPRNDEVHELIEVRKIAPEKMSLLEENRGDSLSEMHGAITNNSSGGHAASWKIMEHPEKKRGLPEKIVLAVLLVRKSQFQDTFMVSIEIDIKTSGFSFEDTETRPDKGARSFFSLRPPHVFKFRFNPATDKSFGLENYLGQVDPQSLGELDLNALVSQYFDNPKFPSRIEVEQAEKEEIKARAAVEARLDRADGATLKQKPDLNPNSVLDPLPDSPKGDGTYALMWGTGVEGLSKGLDPFPKIPATKWRRKLDNELLHEYFPWIDPENSVGSDAQSRASAKPTLAPACVLLFQQLKNCGFRDFNELTKHLSDEDIRPILNVFGLPDEFLDIRNDESGSCYPRSPSTALTMPNDDAEVYVVQTPIYGDEFWYLLVLRMKAPERIAAVLFTDSTINAAEIINTVHHQATEYPHHLLLLLELFKDHFIRTLQLFSNVIGSINKIDSFLLEALPQSDSSNYYKTKDTRFKKTAKEFQQLTLQYAEISHTLHRARIDLVRLRRRRDFKKKLAALLESALTVERRLSIRMQIYSSRASSYETDLKELPQRIESQSSVIYSLAAQQEAQLQYSLTLSTVQDARSMMTLSVITIVFLPGAFIATLFSTNMFRFRDINQEVGIYFAIVVPLTVLLLVAWRAWLTTRPAVFDIESDNTRNKKEKKQNKSD